MRPIGHHAIIDVSGALSSQSGDTLLALMRQAALAGGATILNQQGHEFGGAGGYTGLILLAESHVSVHTWPEHDYAAFDIFMCGDMVHLTRAIEVIEAACLDATVRVKILDRCPPLSAPSIIQQGGV